jgi:hypothetical protein
LKKLLLKIICQTVPIVVDGVGGGRKEKQSGDGEDS